MNSKAALFALSLILVFTACTLLNTKTTKATVAANVPTTTVTKTHTSHDNATTANHTTPTKGETFESFYKRFNQDTAFQMQRVQFPLGGYQMTEEGKQKWSKKEWVYHAATVYDITDPYYKTELRAGEKVATDKIEAQAGDFLFERKFEKVNGKWYLTYCLDRGF